MNDSTVLIPAAGAAIAAIVMSGFVWWATRRNAFWAMGAAVLATLAILGMAVLIGWLVARAAYWR